MLKTLKIENLEIEGQCDHGTETPLEPRSTAARSLQLVRFAHGLRARARRGHAAHRRSLPTPEGATQGMETNRISHAWALHNSRPIICIYCKGPARSASLPRLEPETESRTQDARGAQSDKGRPFPSVAILIQHSFFLLGS